MDSRDVPARAPPKASAGMDHSEEMAAEVDEPPDEMHHAHRTSYFWSPPKLQPGHMNGPPPQYNRRESLLTRQLHSETEHTDDERHPPGRALSTQSTFSNPSTTSTAELTSDDGHSVASPAISPPLAPTHVATPLPTHEKPLERRVRIVGHEDGPAAVPKEAGSEKTVEANLGRKRCITFACKGRQQDKQEPVKSPEPAKREAASPPKRKCMIKFACPTRSASSEKVADRPAKRPASPAPLARRPSADAKAQAFRSHRGSDSTVTHASPKSSRKPSVSRTSSNREDGQPKRPSATRKYSNDSDSEGNEATRFHEFGTSEDEPEDWTRESTCHRSRLTLDDVLKKENVIRQACEEAEEEVVEEEEDDEEEEADDELDEQGDEMAALDQDQDGELDEDEDSDDGFHSDNEAGFASSDDDTDSDYEWWKPGASTAATSVEHLDRLAIVNARPAEHSSVGSASSGRESIRSLRHRHKRHTKTAAMNINNRSTVPDLPDSTDFVCGTLDEDRPLEQAYINRRKMKEAAKHKLRPQDIDPSFPTSDPEMDEEDDDDVNEIASSDEEEEEEHDLMHGGLDEIHEVAPLGRTISNRVRGRSNSHRSPPPPKPFSPPPPKRSAPANKRGTARSPPPRKLFGQSPKRMRSPAPGKHMMTSPPNSPTNEAVPFTTVPHLAERPRLQHTASLPRGGGFMLSQLATVHQQRDESDNENDSDGAATAIEIPKRGAIDIVRGLEKKRRLRKEKLYQKMCAKQAAKGEKQYKVKPGKGCERMRELGLQIQEYKGGKAEHILSL